MSSQKKVTILGAGICGCLLGARLQLLDYQVTVYEKRPDYRGMVQGEGISINLALSARGIEAVEKIGDEGLLQQVRDIMIPMYSRMIHSVEGELNEQSYSKDGKSHINSISRNDLNKILLDYAEEKGVQFHFEAKVDEVDHRRKRIIVDGEVVEYDVCFGTDGAKSIARRSMINMPLFNLSQQYSAHAYKELIMPSDNGDFKLSKDSLHIWPRGTYMMIGLPNMDGTFTMTLFMPSEIFDALDTPEAVREFFEKNYSDLVELLPNLETDYFKNHTGSLMTIRCSPWSAKDSLCLMGDAAHAIVPFFGQGLNCSMQDVTVFMDMLEEIGTENGWEELFKAFEKKRIPDANSISEMALENYIEMRDKVNDPVFKFRKAVIHHLGRAFPDLMNSRYEEVSFSTIPYSLAYRKGEVINEIVDILTAGMTTEDDPTTIDLVEGERLIKEKLVPLSS